MSSQEQQVSLTCHYLSVWFQFLPRARTNSSTGCHHHFWIVFVRFSNQETFKLNQSGRSPLFSQDWDYVVYQRFIQKLQVTANTKESPAQKETNQHRITAFHVMEVMKKIHPKAPLQLSLCRALLLVPISSAIWGTWQLRDGRGWPRRMLCKGGK